MTDEFNAIHMRRSQSFDAKIACELGVEASVVLNIVSQFRNFPAIETLIEMMPYSTIPRIEKALKALREAGYISNEVTK